MLDDIEYFAADRPSRTGRSPTSSTARGTRCALRGSGRGRCKRADRRGDRGDSRPHRAAARRRGPSCRRRSSNSPTRARRSGTTLSSIKVDEKRVHQRVEVAAGGQRRARGEDPGGATRSAAVGAPRRSTAPSRPSSGLHLARERPDHEPVRLALSGNGDCSSIPGSTSASPSGTPIHAAAAARSSTRAGWAATATSSSIDHGNGLATAYGHQSSIAVGNGASVARAR